jgi:uncharacterized membrane protein YqjE
MIEKTLKLTWRKALMVAVVYAALLVAHLAVSVIFHIDEQILLLGAAVVVPLWAISAAVYSFDNLALWRAARWRRSL